MNERILELVEESNISIRWHYDESGSTLKELEKFAELIVRECMGIISDESEKVSDEWRCKDGKHIWWKIKEHFGGQS